MNYLTEIKLFNDWLETEDIPSNAIVLWYGLMFIANRGGWPPYFITSIATIQNHTKLSRSTIRRMRNTLVSRGVIAVEHRSGRNSAIYHLNSFERQFVAQIGEQFEPQQSRVPIVEGQIDDQIEPYNTLNSFISKKEKNIKKKKSSSACQNRKSCAKKRVTTRLNHECLLTTIEEPWRELMSIWLEYKRARKEGYKSELGVKRCLNMLQNLSNNSPQTASVIIDRSIANNWAGLFQLPSRQTYSYGQHIGHILHSTDNDHTQRMLDKFNRKK